MVDNSGELATAAAYSPSMYANDTDVRAYQAQVAAARKLGPQGRVRIAAQMSEDARRISIQGFIRRNPACTEAQARQIVLRALLGEPLASKVWGRPLDP
jgi:hypothetical protein